MYISIINRIATNTTGSYSCLSTKSDVSYHIIFITACSQNVSLQHTQARIRWHHSPTARSITARLRAECHTMLLLHSGSGSILC